MAALALIPLVAGVLLGGYTMWRVRKIYPDLRNDPEETRNFLLYVDKSTNLNNDNRERKNLMIEVYHKPIPKKNKKPATLLL